MSEQTEQAFKHWRLETDADGVLWIHLDKADSSANSLSEEVLTEFAGVLDAAERARPRGAVIVSAKPSGFIAGADIAMIGRLSEVEQPEQLLHESQALFDRLENLPFPTCAAIRGFCLGGGLELALACRYRVADEDADTKLGMPEVMLGLHPGWGGTVRLPRLIGSLEALPLLMTGRSVSARSAAKLGLVDYAVPGRQLLDAARTLVLEAPPRRRPGWKARLSNHPLLRRPLAWLMRRELAKRVRQEHYPAPYAVVDLWERQEGPLAERLAAEARSFIQLARTEVSKNLIRVFFLQERLKDLAKGSDFRPERVHVIGAGTMGGDIAAWCALKGLRVTLQDREPKYIAPAIARAAGLFRKRLKEPRLVTAALDRLMPDVEGLGAARAQVIIEAVPEQAELKRQVLAAAAQRMPSGALLATNTSSIPLDEIASALPRPEALVGIHFFNPVAKMQLVEVVSGERTAAEEAARALGFVGAIGRLPLPVKGTPGFLVNRVLMPYLMEAVTLVAEGVAPALVDEAAERFGMPMGPIELADTVGLDICLHVGEILTAHFGAGDASAEKAAALLRAKVDAGLLGRKSQRGFYEYRNGKPLKPQRDGGDVDFGEIAERMVCRLLNEAVACLHEGVVADADLLDAGMIFGTGFAPFRGGPIHFIRSRGVEQMRQRLEQLQQRYGDRFAPHAEGWARLAAQSAE